jgi:hypothetical protein
MTGYPSETGKTTPRERYKSSKNSPEKGKRKKRQIVASTLGKDKKPKYSNRRIVI